MVKKWDKLTELFLRWVETREFTRQRWHGSFGRELQAVLRRWGNWKNAPRGKPGFKKGRE